MSIKLYCDGSCHHNQTPEKRRAGAGFVATQDGERIHENHVHVGNGPEFTNNVSEYEAVIEALRWRQDEHPDERVDIYTDSNLIVNQINGRWGCNDDGLFVRMVRAKGLMGEEDSIHEIKESRHISRAHDLAQSAATEEEPPETTSPKRKRRSSGSTEKTEIDPGVLDSIPGPVEQPHPGIVPENIPDELKRRVQFINWKVGHRDGKETKVPVMPGQPYKNARANDQSTWSDFATAINTVTPRDVVGLGFVLASEDPYVVIDFDDCRNPDTRRIDPWVMRLVTELDSYSQISVSNTGVHVFLKGDGVPDQWTNKKNQEREMEVYDWGRFITMTGHTIEGISTEITHVPEFGEWLLDKEEELWG